MSQLIWLKGLSFLCLWASLAWLKHKVFLFRAGLETREVLFNNLKVQRSPKIMVLPYNTCLASSYNKIKNIFLATIGMQVGSNSFGISRKNNFLNCSISSFPFLHSLTHQEHFFLLFYRVLVSFEFLILTPCSYARLKSMAYVVFGEKKHIRVREREMVCVCVCVCFVVAYDARLQFIGSVHPIF